MKVFANCIVVVEFEPTTSYKEKTNWRKTITENGGIISYILTKKASFFVVFNKKGSSVSFKLRQCQKYNIPVVSPKYVQHCVSKKRRLDTNNYRLADLNNQEFSKGKIQTTGGRQKHSKKKIVTVNLSSHPSWLLGDVNGPEFDESAFELPKWALLISKEQKKIEALEVHVSTRLDYSLKYRLYAQSGCIENNKVVRADDAVVWYFHTSAEVLSGYEQLYRQYTSKPLSMAVCEPGTIDVENFGSPNLRMVLGKLSFLNEKNTQQVAALTSLIWNEALTQVDAILETPMKYIQEKQIIEAKVVLSLLTEELLHNHGSREGDVKKLIDQFYEVLPHKEEFRSYNWTLREVIGKQDLCQLLSDIVAVSEATDWSPNASVIAKYRAMGCHIQEVDKSMDDFAKIQNLLENNLTKNGGKVHSLYRVRRTVEEVNFQADIGCIRLLTHASPCYNLLGILSRGLLLPNMVTDKLGVSRTDAGNLGAGIYFSDNPSAQYSSQNCQTGTRFLLLSDVALGQICKVYQPDPGIMTAPDGFDSVNGVKTSDERPGAFTENEFAIYNSCQQCLRYLVEFSLPGDVVKEEEHIADDQTLLFKEIEAKEGSPEESTPEKSSPKKSSPNKSSPVEKKVAEIDVSDVKDIPDPLGKVKAGLQGNRNEHIPLKSVHIRGRMMDMVAKVIVLQAYRNDSTKSIEAKYVFPLDNTAAVCGFEAFINGKHIIGEVKEKSKARKEYREAVARGDGAYLMEEETPDVFSVSVGNLPPRSDVLIKITYISELQVQGEAITFNIPASVAPWLRDGALAQKTQTTTESVKISRNKRCNISVMVAIEMPFEIRKIESPSHRVICKKTATKAVVSLPKKCNLDDGFQLNVYLLEIHVPRMWVERHPTDNTQACMLTFYPEFESEPITDPDICLLLDMSNSMKGEAEEQAKKVAVLAMDFLPLGCRFNIIIFGSTYRELFPSAQKYNSISCRLAKQFIQEVTAKLGSTELWEPLHAIQTLSSADKSFQSLFLISDGHVTQELTVLKAVKKSSQRIRLFTLGVSPTVNHHLLRSIATLSGGTYQCYSKDSKSQWQGRLLSQLEKACQPGLTNVHVDWLQTNENATPPTQAPNHIPCLFNKCRQVVYGFVESCTQATLRAKVSGTEVSTMVSTVDLNITSGTMLHQLAAKAVISDYENGNLDDDQIKHQIIKNERKQFIIDLSKKHSIVTPYTSFVAIEDRQQEDDMVSVIPSIEDLIKKETVDILPYIEWDPLVEEKDDDPLTSVREIIKRGELQESYSMVQAEETYASLTEFIEDIKSDSDTSQMVYDKLKRFYEQNHAEVVGNILAEIEEKMIDWQLERLESLKTNNFEEYIKLKSDFRNDMLSKRHCKKAAEWLDTNGWSNDEDTDIRKEPMADYEIFENLEVELCTMPEEITNLVTSGEDDVYDAVKERHIDTNTGQSTAQYLGGLDYSTAIFDPKNRLKKSKGKVFASASKKKPSSQYIDSKASHQHVFSSAVMVSSSNDPSQDKSQVSVFGKQREFNTEPSLVEPTCLSESPLAGSVSGSSGSFRTVSEIDFIEVAELKVKDSSVTGSKRSLKDKTDFDQRPFSSQLEPKSFLKLSKNSLRGVDLHSDIDKHSVDELTDDIYKQTKKTPKLSFYQDENVLDEGDIMLKGETLAKDSIPNFDMAEDEVRDEDEYGDEVEDTELYTAEKLPFMQAGSAGLEDQIAFVTKNHSQMASLAYKTTSQVYSPAMPAYSPTAYKNFSQVYIPTSSVYNPVLPIYNPTTPAFSPATQVYKPGSQMFSSTVCSPKAYSPTLPCYSPMSPRYSPSSPRYSPSSPVYKPASYIYSQTPVVNSSTLQAYKPTTQVKEPVLQIYSQTLPAYIPDPPCPDTALTWFGQEQKTEGNSGHFDIPEPLVHFEANSVENDEKDLDKSRNISVISPLRLDPMKGMELDNIRSKSRQEYMFKRYSTSKQNSGEDKILELSKKFADVENAPASEKTKRGKRVERSSSKSCSITKGSLGSFRRNLLKTRSPRDRLHDKISLCSAEFSRLRDRSQEYERKRSRSRRRTSNRKSTDRTKSSSRDISPKMSYSRSKRSREKKDRPIERLSSRSRTRSRNRMNISQKLKRSKTKNRDRRDIYYYRSYSRSRTRSRDRWDNFNNKAYSRSRPRSRDRRDISCKRSYNRSRTRSRDRKDISRKRSYSRSRTRSRERRDKSHQWSYSRSRTRSRGRRDKSRKRSYSRSRTRSRGRRDISRKRSYSRSRRNSRSTSGDRRGKTPNRSYRKYRWRSRSYSPGQNCFYSPTKDQEMSRISSADKGNGSMPLLGDSMKEQDTSIALGCSTCWQGVRIGNTMEILHMEPEFSKLKECLQTAEESETASRMCYFELTEELCSLIDIDRARVVQILSFQGVKSLGYKTEQRIYRVIATLLTLVVLVKQYPWCRRHLTHPTADSTLTYLVQGNDLIVNIDGHSASVTFQDSLDISAIIRWLEMQDKELPPLYNTLELGKTRLEFLSHLADIYRDL